MAHGCGFAKNGKIMNGRGPWGNRMVSSSDAGGWAKQSPRRGGRTVGELTYSRFNGILKKIIYIVSFDTITNAFSLGHG